MSDRHSAVDDVKADIKWRTSPRLGMELAVTRRKFRRASAMFSKKLVNRTTGYGGQQRANVDNVKSQYY